MGRPGIERAVEGSKSSGSAFHVAGVVVHAVPAEIDSITREILGIPGAFVHASSAAGKIVVTLEGTATDVILCGLERIRTLPGVVAAALVYQHAEDGPEAPVPSLGVSP
jgi:nitrate reductase NapD